MSRFCSRVKHASISSGNLTNSLFFHSDLAQNALIVPLKTLLHADEGKQPEGGVLDIAFHPSQPWILTSGNDCRIRLFS